MEKIFDFIDKLPDLIKNHYYKVMIVINVLGFLFALSCFFSDTLPLICAIVYFFAFEIYWFISLPLLLIINIIAAIAVTNNKSVLGIIFSLLCGSAGGFIVVHTINKNYAQTRIINLIFNVHIWFIIWLATSFLLAYS